MTRSELLLALVFFTSCGSCAPIEALHVAAGSVLNFLVATLKGLYATLLVRLGAAATPLGIDDLVGASRPNALELGKHVAKYWKGKSGIELLEKIGQLQH